MTEPTPEQRENDRKFILRLSAIAEARDEVVAAALEQANEGYGIRPRLGRALAALEALKKGEE